MERGASAGAANKDVSRSIGCHRKWHSLTAKVFEVVYGLPGAGAGGAIAYEPCIPSPLAGGKGIHSAEGTASSSFAYGPYQIVNARVVGQPGHVDVSGRVSRQAKGLGLQAAGREIIDE